MNRIFGFFLSYTIIIFVINLLFWVLVGVSFGPVERLYKNGLLVELPGDRLLVFAHGYNEYYPSGDGQRYIHMTQLAGTEIPTAVFLRETRLEGYKWVWLSQCHTGDEDYLVQWSGNLMIEWPEWVSRNERPGLTVPVFLGPGIYRYSYGY